MPDPFAPDARPAGLLLRVASMVYDAVLVFGIGFGVALLVLLLARSGDPGALRLPLQLALFVAIGAYFVVCWSRVGQTLALKTWKLRVVDASGQPPTLMRSIARYLLAYSLALPGIAWIVLFHPPSVGALAALAIGLALMLLPALIDRERRLLHDRLSGTRIVRADEA